MTPYPLLEESLQVFSDMVGMHVITDFSVCMHSAFWKKNKCVECKTCILFVSFFGAWQIACIHWKGNRNDLYWKLNIWANTETEFRYSSILDALVVCIQLWVCSKKYENWTFWESFNKQTHKDNSTSPPEYQFSVSSIRWLDPIQCR